MKTEAVRRREVVSESMRLDVWEAHSNSHFLPVAKIGNCCFASRARSQQCFNCHATSISPFSRSFLADFAAI